MLEFFVGDPQLPSQQRVLLTGHLVQVLSGNRQGGVSTGRKGEAGSMLTAARATMR